MVFLLRYPTLKIIDLVVLVTAKELLPVTFTTRIGVELGLGDRAQLRRARHRLHALNLIDAHWRLDYEAVRLLEQGLGTAVRTSPPRPAGKGR